MGRRRGAALAAGLVAVPFLFGCSASTSGPTEASSSSKTIGVVVQNLADVNQGDILKGYQDQGAKYGWTIKSVDTQGDPAKANAAMKTYVQQEVAGIVSMVYEGSTLRAGISAAQAAGIPVILNGTGTLVPGVAAAISLDSGQKEAEALVKELGGNGKVLMFTFPPGAPCVQQFNSSKPVMDANPGITYTTHDVPAPGWIAEAQKATGAWLQTNPAGSGKLAIWACWDGPAFGAIAALAANKRTDVKVFGNGGEPDALTAIQNGKMTASVFFDQYTGGGLAGATLLHDAIEAGSSWQPKVVPNPNEIVDSGNVAAVCAKYPDKCR